MQAVTIAPILKALRHYHSDEWEIFVRECVRGMRGRYQAVLKMGATGDLGRDVVGFADDDRFAGVWDNYQCKHYSAPLSPSRAGLEIAKIIYYSFMQEFTPPKTVYFVCPRDVSTELQSLLGKPLELRNYILEHWDSGYSKHISER
jgi:hypothetical protein